ncbi:nucleoside 2-deoxyribosyltransferase [Nocardiopsis mwathae]|uniref:Nucleoside 2-deoxyribosyltransferase n=1 Tax=Nocardiopsis mwathae TaxID=1472723 RepID=A0A7W9YH50_9ACTN|nr:nucleoside 2-deoxyribosyltransferase [Nocardiopsis mwathae]
MTLRRIAITGHRGLPPDVAQAVDTALRDHLAPFDGDMVGMSCLADGADAIFARAVVDAGAPLEVVVPAEAYRDALPAEHHPEYDALLRRAVLVHRLPHLESTPEAHMDAGRHMVDHCDELVAVWDGGPSRGEGGTADVVGYANAQECPVVVVWPQGARR